MSCSLSAFTLVKNTGITLIFPSIISKLIKWLFIGYVYILIIQKYIYMRISLYFLCLQDSGLSAWTIRSFIDSWTFSSTMSDYCLIPVILISFSGVSIIFRLDNFSIYPRLFIFFYLFPTFWEKIFMFVFCITDSIFSFHFCPFLFPERIFDSAIAFLVVLQFLLIFFLYFKHFPVILLQLTSFLLLLSLRLLLLFHRSYVLL